MNRKVRNKILEEMKQYGSLDKEYVVQLIKTYDEKPDVSRLIEQHYKAKADRLISSFKDENKIRDCFAIKTAKNKTKYIDLSKAHLLSVKEIELVRIKQENAKRNKEEIIKKANISKKVLTGQIRIEDYQKALKQELRREVV